MQGPGSLPQVCLALTLPQVCSCRVYITSGVFMSSSEIVVSIRVTRPRTDRQCMTTCQWQNNDCAVVTKTQKSSNRFIRFLGNTWNILFHLRLSAVQLPKSSSSFSVQGSNRFLFQFLHQNRRFSLTVSPHILSSFEQPFSASSTRISLTWESLFSLSPRSHM